MNKPTIAAVLLSGVIGAVESKAANIAGGDKVTDDLKVAPTQ